MFNIKNKYNLIFLILFAYSLLCITYILLEVNIKISVSNPIGATLYDQNTYHIPQINYFLRNGIDFTSYNSFTATTPGQHLIYTCLLSLLSIKQVDGNTIELRLLHLIFNLVTIFLIWLLLYTITRKHESIIYSLPLICSPYFINGALYITTDNVAIGITVAVLIFIISQNYNFKNILYANIFNTVSILWRQNTIWLQGPIFIKNIKTILNTKKYSSLIPHLLPVGLLILFIISWGGLTPREFQLINSKALNFSSIIYSISLFVILSIFYLYDLYFLIKKIEKQLIIRITIIGIIIGISIGIFIPSEMNHQAGRWGGYLWSISSYLPSIYERSIFFIFLTILGSVLLSYIFYLLWISNEVLIIVAFLSWLISNVGSFIVFHRYYEPMLILFISIFILKLNKNTKYHLAGPAILAIIMLLIFTSSLVL